MAAPLLAECVSRARTKAAGSPRCESCAAKEFVVGSTELESVTSCVSSRRSNQLSYEPIVSGTYGWTRKIRASA